jgi:hypothetical protein
MTYAAMMAMSLSLKLIYSPLMKRAVSLAGWTPKSVFQINPSRTVTSGILSLARVTVSTMEVLQTRLLFLTHPMNVVRNSSLHPKGVALISPTRDGIPIIIKPIVRMMAMNLKAS